MKVFVNKKINNTTRVVSLLGLELYKTEDTDDARTQYFLGNFIYTKKIKSKIKELKTYKIFNFPISTRIIEDDICSYYCLGKLINQNHLAELFFKNNLQKVKDKYDDVYILHSNSGEIYLFFAYLAKAFIKKNQSKNPLFVATQKYHIDILKMYFPEAHYIYINELRLKTQSDIWNMPNHRYFILFSGNHFEKVEQDIKNNDIGSIHYLTSMLKTLNLTEKDFSMPEVIPSLNSQKLLSNAVNKMQLKLNNFIIIAPEAMTCEDLPLSFWQKIVQELKNRNFDIFLNITNYKNYIAGCKQFELGFTEAFFLAHKAKAVISLRSGFSEFLLPTETPNISIYTKFRKRTRNAFSVEKGIEGFSMLKMPFVNKNKICEINADLYKNEEELVTQVIGSLETMLNKEECLL